MSELVIQRISIDSREVRPGDLFMAVQGITVDGRDYIEDAIQKGAVAVLVDTEGSRPFVSPIRENSNKIPIIPIPHLRTLMGPIASRFFSEPSKQIPVIGITGTNGKTSTSHFLAEILTRCGKPCGIMGTLGIGFPGKLEATHCTTPDAIVVQQALRNLSNQAATAVAMEVTSHALEQSRVSGVQFHTAIFTNLTRDHLDYHIDMDQYAKAKQKLFLECNPKFSIINLDDPFGVQLVQSILKQKQKNQKIIGYTTASNSPYTEKLDYILTTESLSLTFAGMHAMIETPWGKGEVNSSLLGSFNFSNLLAAIAAACIQDIPLLQVLHAISDIKTVNGRMMRFGGVQGLPLVIVDYAHKPEALNQVLAAFRAHCQGKLWCVFGCGGDRDRGKRPIMAAIAERLSDHICLTQDNPRTEDPDQIMNEMIAGLQNPLNAVIEFNRKNAIWNTIMNAKSEDCVVIAGKGHEEYQIFGTEKKHFSDREEVENALKERRI